ncbi:nucleoid-structuring protein H-NS [Ekhidna sp.]|uniref:nucleoid-structuring protein H-NS n=1 Tax=Ekhidna sp. TaxID=2608089 RepID=UPI003CCBA435
MTSISKNYLILTIASVLVFTSCKNQKKMADLSDPTDVQEQVEQGKPIGQEDSEDNSKQVEKSVSKKPVESLETRVNSYFSAIANASSLASANNSIEEALTLFSSSDTPVLIVFYESNGTPSYDEPTTIEKYLNYLKDTNNNKARVDEMVKDSSGKIKEIVLKKSK